MSRPAARKRHSKPSINLIRPGEAHRPESTLPPNASLTPSKVVVQKQPASQDRQLPKVSLCTVTYNRARLLPLLEKCILNQTYPRSLLEWVIVDDSDSGQPRFHPSPGTGLHSRIVSVDKKLPLGKKRNLSHNYCDHEIIVYMDDDEYYPPTRVEHAVHKLIESGLEVAGSTNLPILFIPERMLWMAGPFNSNHATANTFAFRRSLLDKTRYEDSATHAEEKAFLKNYSFPMVQLEPRHTVICFGHHSNTFDKRRLIGDGTNPRMRQVDINTLGDWIPVDLIDDYQNAHQLTTGSIEPPAQPAAGPSATPEDPGLLLLCSPPGSGIQLINEILVKLGSLEIVGDAELDGVIAPRFLNYQTLEPIESAANGDSLLRNLKRQLSEFRHKAPHSALLLREPYGAPIVNSLANHIKIKLVICLRPMAEIAEAMKHETPSKTASIAIVHRLYGQLFSIITNTDLPFHLLRYADLIASPRQTIAAMASFSGLSPTEEQLIEACQWVASKKQP